MDGSKKQFGMATFVTTVILLVAAMLVMFYASQYSFTLQKTTTNQFVGNQASAAADAGIEYGLAYLNANSSTITGSASGGFINYSLAPVTLSNNARFTVAYTNPTASNYKLILITSTGVSADGTSTSTTKQRVYLGPPTLATVMTLGSVTVDGIGGEVTGNPAVNAGGSVDDGVSAGGQIIENNPTISSMSTTAFFQYIFNRTKAQMQSASTVYSASGSIPWNSLTGTVWINGNAAFSGNITVGTPANPVLLIVNGDFGISAGNATINGVVYVTGTVDMAGNGTVNGAIISESNMNFRGNGGADYNAAIVANIMNGFNPGLSGYSKVSGSWIDF